MSKRDSTLTQKRLKELLHYDPDTGVFIWLVRPARKIQIGDVAGYISDAGYRMIGIENTEYRAHRLAWLYVYGHWPEGEIDHKHGKQAGDGIDNLRVGTHAFNMQNVHRRRRHNKSGFLGVHWAKNERYWVAAIRVNGKTKWIGRFDTPEEAHAAYLKARRSIFEGNTL